MICKKRSIYVCLCMYLYACLLFVDLLAKELEQEFQSDVWLLYDIRLLYACAHADLRALLCMCKCWSACFDMLAWMRACLDVYANLIYWYIIFIGCLFASRRDSAVPCSRILFKCKHRYVLTIIQFLYLPTQYKFVLFWVTQ